MRVLFRYLDHRSRLILGVLTLLFLGLETCYAVYRPLSLDEFNGTWSIAQLATGVPYVDFQPYKPVLGYSIQLALLSLAPDTWSGFLAVRLGMVYLTGGILFLGTLAPTGLSTRGRLPRVRPDDRNDLSRRVGDRGAARHVDGPGRLRLAALAVEPANRARGGCGRAKFPHIAKGHDVRPCRRHRLTGISGDPAQQRSMRDVLVYGGCVVLPISLYVLYWSLIASFPSVFRPTFAQETQLHAIRTSPHSLRNLCELSWAETLIRNPFFYLCALWAFSSLIALGRGRSRCETLLLFYGGTVLGVMLSLAQPWPYCFVLLVPTIFVLHADVFTRTLEGPRGLHRPGVFLLCYSLFGLLWPLSGLAVVAKDDTGPQRQTIELTEALLGPEDRYFAGFQLLYRRDANARALSETDETSAHPTHELTADQTAGILEPHWRKSPFACSFTTSRSMKKCRPRSGGTFTAITPRCGRTSGSTRRRSDRLAQR